MANIPHIWFQTLPIERPAFSILLLVVPFCHAIIILPPCYSVLASIGWTSYYEFICGQRMGDNSLFVEKRLCRKRQNDVPFYSYYVYFLPAYLPHCCPVCGVYSSLLLLLTSIVPPFPVLILSKARQKAAIDRTWAGRRRDCCCPHQLPLPMPFIPY